MKRKILAAVLCICLLLGGLGFRAEAADVVASGSCGENVKWSLDSEGTLTISGSGRIQRDDSSTRMPWYSVRGLIRNVIIKEGVTGIGNYAFSDCFVLTSVTIPESVTGIGSYAFSDCVVLTSVTIPGNVWSIHSSTFYGCTSLTNVTIPNSVSSIEDSAFKYCTSLTSVTIPDSVRTIGYSAFYDCTSLTSVTIPNGVLSIGRSAFYGCTGLTSVTISNSVTSIEDAAFFGCTKLSGIWVAPDNSAYSSDDSGVLFDKAKTKLICCPGNFSGAYKIPSSVTNIEDRAFYLCTGLTSVAVPGSVTSIGTDAFRNCTGLTDIAISNGVTEIKSSAFKDCISLTSITIPSSVTSIGDGVFGGCAKLSGIWVNPNNSAYSNDASGVLFNKAKTALICCPQNISGAYEIPTGVTNIRIGAFADCIGLTSVVIPNSVTSIDFSAFYNCTALTSITIPNSVKKIECPAFRGCAGLTGIWVDSDNPTYSSNENGVLFNKEKTELIRCPGGFSGTYEIPDSVTKVGAYAFSDCADLTNVIIPDTLSRIGDYAFYNCTGLTGAIIPDSVTLIASCAFYKCTALTNVSIGSKAYIQSLAFSRCDNLSGIWVSPDNLIFSSDENGVLFNKDKTSLVCCPGGISGAYEIPDSVTSIEYYAFSDCAGLTSVTVPENVTSIGTDAFRNCAGLTSVCFHGNAPEIDSNVFQLYDESIYRYFNIPGLTLYFIEGKDGWSTPTWGTEKYPTATWDGVNVPQPHQHVYTIAVTAPTCTEQGYTTHTCVCGDSYKDTYTAALGHNYVPARGVEATCTSPEMWEWQCTRCKDNYIVEGAPALGHAWNDGEITTPATEDQPGVKTYTCTRCSATRTEELPPLTHTHVYSDTVVAPTCTTGGYTTHTCRCGYSYKDTFTAALGHDYYAAAGSDATCTAAAWTEYNCSRCGDHYRVEGAPALGHAWNDGEITTPATEEQPGVKTYTCTRCSATRTEAIPPLTHAHVYSDTVVAPTCTEQGYTTHTCVCGYSYKDTFTAALGHNYIPVRGVEATCTSPEMWECQCTRCKDSYVDEGAPALGHDFRWVIDQEATVDAPGYQHEECTRCHAPRSENTLIPVLDRVCDGGDSCPGRGFSDMPAAGNWAHAGIDYCVSHGLMNGVGKGQFDPNGTLTRAMLVTVLYRVQGEPDVSGLENPFEDVPDGMWYSEPIIWAVSKQVVNGTSAATFEPDAPITREQIAAILYRYAKEVEGADVSASAALDGFADAASVSAYARTPLGWASAIGYIKGSNEDGTLLLNPQGNATRAEVATILMRYLER